VDQYLIFPADAKLSLTGCDVLKESVQAMFGPIPAGFRQLEFFLLKCGMRLWTEADL